MNKLQAPQFCSNCKGSLAKLEKVLFVELEIGRVFCNEDCIHAYFLPTIQWFQEEFLKQRSETDFETSELSELQRYRLQTLTDPDEIWANVTEIGDHIYTYIAHYNEGEEKLHYVVIALQLEGEPSFVLFEFGSRDESLLEYYRQGIDLRVHDQLDVEAPAPNVPNIVPTYSEAALDELDQDQEVEGYEGTDLDELYRENRKSDDIPINDFPKYQDYVDPALEDPDEIWAWTDEDGNQWCSFIAKFSGDMTRTFTMIVVCRMEKNERGQKNLEMSLAFPTIDHHMIQLFRRGINALSKSFQFGTGDGDGYAA